MATHAALSSHRTARLDVAEEHVLDQALTRAQAEIDKYTVRNYP